MERDHALDKGAVANGGVKEKGEEGEGLFCFV